MSKQMIADLEQGQTVGSIFVLKSMALADFANRPGKYLNLTLGDASGEIQARVWEDAEKLAEWLSSGDVVEVEGRVDAWQGRLQVIVRGIRPVKLCEAPLELLCAHSPRDRGEMLAELDAAIASVEQPHLRALLDGVFGDEALRERFATSPGAKAIHHAYLGGLLEHTLNVIELCRCAARLHPGLNRDLLITAAILHDLGKCEEIEGSVAFSYSDAGHFIGHVVITDRIVMEHIRKVSGFPEHLANLLTHILLAHHGQREWGAPVTAAIAEACALHYADNLDARVQGYEDQRVRQARAGGDWSSYFRAYDTYLYLGPTGAESEALGKNGPPPE